MIRGKTFYVSTVGLLLLAPARYRVGDRIDLEIFVRTTLSVRCKGRVAASGTPYQIELDGFAAGDLKVWNDALMNVRRARLKRE